MGYIKHHTIVVTGWQDEKLKEAHQKAKEVFEKNFESEPYEKPFAGIARPGRQVYGLITHFEIINIPLNSCLIS